MADSAHNAGTGLQGPKCWVVSLAVGLLIGAGLALVLPTPAALTGGIPDIPVYLGVPFVLLLLSIALIPFISARFWARHHPDVAFLLGGVMIAFYLIAYRGFQVLPPGAAAGAATAAYGPMSMLKVAEEYFQFIALIGSLYVVAGGLLIDVRGEATPAVNTAILGSGAILANIFGTTGASVLLIRPYLRINQGRLAPYHVILFIFIVSNCGGCLTPIGDPPLFLGYLQGVPFTWTLMRCLPAWAVAVGALLAVFYFLDSRVRPRDKQPISVQPEVGVSPRASPSVKIELAGWLTFFFLFLVLLGVFLDQILAEHLGLKLGFPVGAAFQVVVAIVAYKLADPEILRQNRFTFHPLKEVALLFAGIFATVAPALGYLENHALDLGVATPTAFFWDAGALSSFLDNAPTYLTYLSAAHGLAGMNVGPDQTPLWIHLNPVGCTAFSAERLLLAISLGSVFFGANTYIGNGPNFMMKTIAEDQGVAMPSFFGYVFKYTLPIMVPILAVIWLLFIR